MACTTVLTGQGSDAVDEVEIDFSPLRASREAMDALSEKADAVAAELEASRVERELEQGEALGDGTAAVGGCCRGIGAVRKTCGSRRPDRITDGDYNIYRSAAAYHTQEYELLATQFLRIPLQVGAPYPE